jgi:hypothetical protein
MTDLNTPETIDQNGNRGSIAVTLVYVLGLVIATGLGGAGTYFVQLQSEEEELQVRRQEAISAISRTFYERYTRTRLLRSALSMPFDLQDLRERRAQYDQSYVSLNSNIQVNLFLARGLLDPEIYSDYHKSYEQLLSGCMFRPIDRHLTDWYVCRTSKLSHPPAVLSQAERDKCLKFETEDAARREELTVAEEPGQCGITKATLAELLDSTNQCIYEMSRQLNVASAPASATTIGRLLSSIGASRSKNGDVASVIERKRQRCLLLHGCCLSKERPSVTTCLEAKDDAELDAALARLADARCPVWQKRTPQPPPQTEAPRTRSF